MCDTGVLLFVLQVFIRGFGSVMYMAKMQVDQCHQTETSVFDALPLEFHQAQTVFYVWSLKNSLNGPQYLHILVIPGLNRVVTTEFSVNFPDHCINRNGSTLVHAVQSKVQHDGHVCTRKINIIEKRSDVRAPKSSVVLWHPGTVNHRTGGAVIVYHNRVQKPLDVDGCTIIEYLHSFYLKIRQQARSVIDTHSKHHQQSPMQDTS